MLIGVGEDDPVVLFYHSLWIWYFNSLKLDPLYCLRLTCMKNSLKERFYLTLQVWTPNVITLWEALLTVLQFGLLLTHAYAQDKRWPYLSLPLYVFFDL